MRLFKANQPHQSEEDRARDARLTNIASRYRPRADQSGEEPPELPLSDQAPEEPQ
jgi:hypothetical protein